MRSAGAANYNDFAANVLSECTFCLSILSVFLLQGMSMWADLEEIWW